MQDDYTDPMVGIPVGIIFNIHRIKSLHFDTVENRNNTRIRYYRLDGFTNKGMLSEYNIE